MKGNEKMDKIKNQIIIILLFIILVMIIGGGIYLVKNKDYVPVEVTKEEKNNEDDPVIETEDSTIKSLTFKEFQTKYNNGDQLVLVIVQTGCGFCEAFEPTLTSALEDLNMVGYKLDLVKITDKEEQAAFAKIIKISGTPTTIIVKDGKIVNTLTGNTELETVEIWLRAYFEK